MNKKIFRLTSLLLITVMFLSSCSSISSALSKTASQLNIAQAASPTATASTGSSSQNPSTSAPAATSDLAMSSDLLTAYENALENIYATVSPQVVNIMVLSNATSDSAQFFHGFNNNPQSQTPPLSQALGSGFVWDTQGHIVTNNHVVEGTTKVEVTFSDGTTVPATVVGTDPYSDLAVIQVDASSDVLHPVTMADSTQVKVGEIAIAIGNPFGFEGSMTVGNVSGIGRDLPSNQGAQASGASYSIPDVIQTDASINPGNSGGVLVNDQGQVIGVTSALESASGSSSGIGFAIPSSIVSKVVPELIANGKYDHPYLGISGISLTPDIAQAMNLPEGTRGALIVDVAPSGPADKAGLLPSTTTVTINGASGLVGGDVITAIDGHTVNSMSDIIAYLANNTRVDQTVTLTILRNAETQTVNLTLGSRPTQ